MLKWLIPVLVGFAVIVALVAFVINKPKLSENTRPIPAPTNNQTVNNQYLPYSPEAVAAASDKQKLLFFHANWCPICRATEEEILENILPLPKDLIIFKTDYDSEKELKQKYGITYQHTFVLIDNRGNELIKWNGGGVEEIVNQLI